MNSRFEKLGFFLLIIILAILPIYSNLVYGLAHIQYERQLAFIRGESYFFNPWQYRVLAPFLIEGIGIVFKIILNYKTIPEELYSTIFKALRFAQHLVIFALAWKFYSYFTKNRYLLFLSIIIIAWSIGQATFRSDFSFNNYFDVIFYLLAVLIIFSNKNIAWFLPLSFLAALNRETSLLLPFVLLLNYQSFWGKGFSKKNWSVFIGSLLAFLIPFALIRYFYGYPKSAPIGITPGLPMLKFNLTDTFTIMELFGTLSVFPLFTLLLIRKTDIRMQILFWLLAPAWFGVHFWLVWARETRIFLVPLIVVFLPICLDLIQKAMQKPESEL